MSPSQIPPSLPQGYDLAWALWQRRARERSLLRRQASEDVYAHIWGALAQWGVARALPAHQIQAADLANFLAERALGPGLTPRHAWRITRLVERILQIYHRELGLPPSSAAAQLLERRPDIRYANAARFDALPQAVAPADAARLARFVAQPQPAGTAWQLQRNRAAVALHLGAGLTPAEVRALSLDAWSPTRPMTIRVGAGAGGANEVPLPRWAARALTQWLSLRAELGIPGPRLFPSTRSSGKPWGKVAHHEGVKAVLALAGLASQDLSAYNLRHGFALHCLHRRTPPEQLGRWLGITEPDVLERYQRLRAEHEEEAAWLRETS